MIKFPVNNIHWVLLGLISSQILVLLNFIFGNLKSASELDWVDITGEGGTSLIIFVWWWFLVSGRPGGRVSNFIISGILFLFLGAFQDGLDEFVNFPTHFKWLESLEAVFLPLGMILLTVGLFLWRDEQKIITDQLSRRERFFRDHRVVDSVTQLSDIRYLNQHIDIALQKAQGKKQPFSLLLIDIDDFQSINRQYGHEEGDRLLQATAELLVLNLRTQDLVCRFAGDRFAILLENTSEFEAEQLLGDSLNFLNHYHFRTLLGEKIPLKVSGGLANYRNDCAKDILYRAKKELLKAKESRHKIKPNAA